MSNAEHIARNSKSESFKKLNPHIFEAKAPMVTAASMIRQSSKPLLNKWETEFLEQLKGAGWKTILCQSMKFRLANGVWYIPDFICLQETRLLQNQIAAAFEVKGHMRDDASVKIKVAAGMYPWVAWRLATKQNGQWVYQLVT